MTPTHRDTIPPVLHTILFDMDGVITSEACYWDAARLTVLEVLGHPGYASWKAVGFEPQAPLETLLAHSQHLLSNDTIAQIKARALNTNWDVAYVMASLYLIEMAALLPWEHRQSLGQRIEGSGWKGPSLHVFGQLLAADRAVPSGDKVWSAFAGFLGERAGFEALEALNAYWQARTGNLAAPFRRGGEFWLLCQDLFQAWYLGDKPTQPCRHADEEVSPERSPRKGLIHRELPLLPAEQVRETLAWLREAGCTLGVATGRPYPEIVMPLERMGLLSFFDQAHFATHREVETAEEELRREGLEVALSKPHPFLFLRALYPSLSAREIWAGCYSTEAHRQVAVVGDAVSDVVAAKAIGCYSISVLTGAGGAGQPQALQAAGTDLIFPDMTHLKSFWKGTST